MAGGCAPEGAVDAVWIASSISSRGTGSGEKCRTLRRSASSAQISRPRRNISASGQRSIEYGTNGYSGIISPRSHFNLFYPLSSHSSMHRVTCPCDQHEPGSDCPSLNSKYAYRDLGANRTETRVGCASGILDRNVPELLAVKKQDLDLAPAMLGVRQKPGIRRVTGLLISLMSSAELLRLRFRRLGWGLR